MSETIPAGIVDFPLVVVAIAFAIAVTLVLVRFGAAVLDAETLR